MNIETPATGNEQIELFLLEITDTEAETKLGFISTPEQEMSVCMSDRTNYFSMCESPTNQAIPSNPTGRVGWAVASRA